MNEDRVLTVFLVEDSPMIRDNLIATLEELAPVRVLDCEADEPGAVRWLAEDGHRPDLVIVDLFLRSGSGLGVLRSMREQGHGAEPVVLTNYATPDMRRRCEDLGATRVFDKSTDIDELISYCAQRARSRVPPSAGASAV